MIENWFTRKCEALVGENGRALSGDDLASAEASLTKAKQANCKLWTDKNGYICFRERKLFAKVQHLADMSGRPIRICGHLVKIQAKFCSKCGSPAPGGWWRCGNCGMHIGNESKSCPHCGTEQHPATRSNMSGGVWNKGSEVFAERFEYNEISSLLDKGFNVQENHRAILLDGGVVSSVLEPGFYGAAEMNVGEGEQANRSIVMIDNANFDLPLCVPGIRTSDDLESELHTTITLRFNPEKAGEFMRNLMGSSLYIQRDTMTVAVGYDAIAMSILQNADDTVRRFCNSVSCEALFKDATLRNRLETELTAALRTTLETLGLRFVGLKTMEFESAAFEKMRELSGQTEEKRREIEFMQRADAIANDATRRKVMSEAEMEDFVKQVAHENGIKDELREHEIARIRAEWKHQQAVETLNKDHDLDDIEQLRVREREFRDIEYELKELNMRHTRELETRIADRANALETMKIDIQVEELKLDLRRKQQDLEREDAAKWLEVKKIKETFRQNQKIEMMKATAGVDLSAVLATTDDPDQRRDLLKVYEMQQQAKMTPELLLATAAARGNAGAAEALSRMSQDQIRAIEQSKAENRDLFEKMLQMNERMFNQATKALSEKNPGSGNTTQIIK